MKLLSLLWIGIYILCYFSESGTYVILTSDAENNSNTKKACIKAAILKTSFLLSVYYFRILLPIFYFMVILGYGITFLSIYGKNRNRFLFWMNFFGICFTAVHLICLGLTALFTQYILKEVYQNDGAYIWSIIFTLIILNLIHMLWKKKSLMDKLSLLTKDTRRLHQLIFFEWYAIGYLLFDSITCLFKLPYILLSVFLIGSCLLLLFQLFLFMAHTCRIVERAHCEAEYYRLEAERADHVKRQMILHKLAYTDSLTGAFTRRYAMEMLNSMKKDRLDVTISYIDVNGLKKVNDTLGHSQGDRYLKIIANKLNQSLDKSDILARVGGDEFLVISNSSRLEVMGRLMERVNEELKNQECEGGLSPSFSYGIVSASSYDSFEPEELLKESDRRMYAYKKAFKKGGGQ